MNRPIVDKVIDMFKSSDNEMFELAKEIAEHQLSLDEVREVYYELISSPQERNAFALLTYLEAKYNMNII